MLYANKLDRGKNLVNMYSLILGTQEYEEGIVSNRRS